MREDIAPSDQVDLTHLVAQFFDNLRTEGTGHHVPPLLACHLGDVGRKIDAERADAALFQSSDQRAVVAAELDDRLGSEIDGDPFRIGLKMTRTSPGMVPVANE